MAAVLRTLLLAPVDVTGGIATWARALRDNAKDLDIETVDTAQRRISLGDERMLLRVAPGAGSAVRTVARVMTACLRRRPDVTYITCAPSMGLWIRDFPIILALRVLRIPVVLHLHGGSENGYFGSHGWSRAIAGLVYGQVAAMIVSTTRVERLAAERFGRDKVSLLPNMVPDLFAREPSMAPAGRAGDDERLVALHVGAQTESKGTLDVLRLAGEVRDVDYVLVGPIPPDMTSRIDALMADLQLHHHVTFRGELVGEDLVGAFRSADLFLFPSHAEGFPMVILEAMGCGLAILATDVGGVPAALGSGGELPAGVVVPAGPPVDHEQLASALRTLVSRPDLRAELGANGRVRALTSFSANTVVPQVEGILLAAAGRH
jgi:glycosyltransferase involved in cell wall biosynthesis